MKAYLLTGCALSLAALAGCASTAPLSNSQVQTYLQACASYDAAVKTATAAVQSKSVSLARAQQIRSVVDSTQSFCEGQLPANPSALTPKILKAVSQLAVPTTQSKVK